MEYYTKEELLKWFDTMIEKYKNCNSAYYYRMIKDNMFAKDEDLFGQNSLKNILKRD